MVSANECPTERINQFVNFFLQPLSHHNRSHSKDTTDSINVLIKIKQLPGEKTILSSDVTSLYTNILLEEAIAAIRRFLAKHRCTSAMPTNESLCELLRFVLSRNNFQFDGKNHLQVGGTAMGTKVAPSLANIFMADLEENIIYHI